MSTGVPTQTVSVHDGNGGMTNKESVFYPDVLSKAHEEGLSQVSTELVQTPFDENGYLAIVKATIKTSRGEFQAYGDASPDSVESTFVPHLVRVAETRAKARAFRDAVNVGVVAYEELNGASPHAGSGNRNQGTASPSTVPAGQPSPSSGNGLASMTDGQRRYLYRLVATRGFRGDAANRRILELFGVPALSQISKSAAGQMIDRLLAENAQGGEGANAQH